MSNDTDTKYEVNDAGVQKAQQMIDAGQYDLDTEWSDGQPGTDAENDKIDRDGYEAYGEWHLAIDTDASEETKDRYGFPFGDFRRVFRSGLIAAEQRAAQRDHTAVEKAAADLLERIDQASSS